jgi:ATP-dependent DNA ligase
VTTSKAGFIKPTLLLGKTQPPDDPGWFSELKLDGYRAVAFKTGFGIGSL